MDLGIKNKTALVLGAGGGLGSAISCALAREGVNVVAADIDLDAAERTAEDIRDTGAQSLVVKFDLANLGEIDPTITFIEQELGPIDILVNNTGGPPPTPAFGQDAVLWSAHFQSMVLSIIKTTDRVLPSMRKRKWGRIITSTSSGVVAPIPNLAISNALRLSLVGWSKTLAREVAREGVTANIVLPGRIATHRIRMLDQAKAQRDARPVEEIVDESLASIPAGRYGSPQEYGEVVAFFGK